MNNAKLYLMPMNTFGELVRDTRLEQNLSQRELAHRIGKSATYINYVERGFNPSAKGGRFKVSAEAVDLIAKELKADVDKFRLAAGYAPEHRQLPHEKLSLINTAYEQLPPDKKVIIDLILESVEKILEEIAPEVTQKSLTHKIMSSRDVEKTPQTPKEFFAELKRLGYDHIFKQTELLDLTSEEFQVLLDTMHEIRQNKIKRTVGRRFSDDDSAIRSV